MEVKMIRLTPEEAALERASIMAHMENKYITGRTPENFKARALALADGDKVQAAAELATEQQTFCRWCKGATRIPGVAWVALDALERLKGVT